MRSNICNSQYFHFMKLMLELELQDLEAKYVPKKIVNSGKSKPIWMTYRAVKAVKRRHKIFRKYKDPEHPACKKADKKASVFKIYIQS